MGFALFRRQPTAMGVRGFLERAIQIAGRQPRYLVTDHGRQFIARNFRRWCRRRGIRQHFGAIGIVHWYNAHRPHSGSAAATPDEIYHRRPAAARSPRFEPRPPLATPLGLRRTSGFVSSDSTSGISADAGTFQSSR
jgi:transposase InsO family protein